MKIIKVEDSNFDEFIMIILMGIYECYNDGILNAQEMAKWCLNGKVSKALHRYAKNEEVLNFFEAFEEVMRFEAMEDRDIINFDIAYLKIKEKFISIFSKLSRNEENKCLLEIMDLEE